jgi:hypothetical protein
MLVVCKSGLAQGDTLSLVNASLAEKKIEYAAGLLAGYSHRHPKDFNALWLYAQTEYWLKHVNHSIELYEMAMQLQPTNAYLQLDYARMLINTAHYRKAQDLLLKLTTYDVTRSAALYERSKSYFWQKNNVRAQREALNVVHTAPSDDAKKLLNDISFAAAPWIKISSSFTSDTQPLQTFSPSFESGISLHRFFSPYAGYYLPTFMYGGNVVSAPWIVVGNQFSFGQGPEIKVELGSVRFPYHQTQEVTRKLYARQKLGKYVALDFLAEHKPYFSTLRSIDTLVRVNHYLSSIELSKPEGVLGKIAFDENHFADNNDVISFYSYLLLPPFKMGATRLRFGYSFAFNDSRKNQFVPKESFSEIVAKGVPIAGIYDPYFTPQRQVINSVVASWLIPFSKWVKMGINSNVAFYATTSNPYFYLEKRPPNTYLLYKDYAALRYTPWDLSAYLQWQPSPRWTLRGDYQYKSTFFFQSNYVGLSINTVLFHEQK